MTKIIILMCTLVALINLNGCAAPLLVAGGAAAGVAGTATDRRSAGMIVEDQSIELKIGKQIYEHPELKRQVHINITSFNGVVLLSGEAPDAHRRDLMSDIARRVAQVRAVHNEVTIATESTLGSRSKDALITGRVKARIAADKELNPVHVKVVTEAQTVYLMGIVNKREADVATHIARELTSDKQVVRLFEYTGQ